ncbi:MAG: hypothetical protein JJT96_15445, partial [Opitutales bacterium]|nr:hypothetical protein [Opitutales bacterium]
GTPHELPYLEFQINRPDHETDKVRRDKILFKDMGLPVSTQWLYERHRVPPPNPGEERFDQPLAPDAPSPANTNPGGGTPAAPGGTGSTPAGVGQGLATATPDPSAGTFSTPSSGDGGFASLEAKNPATPGGQCSVIATPNDRGRDAGLTGTPPSEPDVRISRIRLSSQQLPPEWRLMASALACLRLNRPSSVKC